MKNKLKTIGLIISGMILAFLLWLGYATYYQAIYNKGYNEATELTNLYIELNNILVDQCGDNPDRCGYIVKETMEYKPKMEMR